MSEAGGQQSGSGRDPNLVGLLSLQLLLLAFFILLVSMSSFDTQRVRSVLGSVQSAFSDASSTREGDAETNRADAIVLDAITDEIEGVLATALQLDRVERVGGGAVDVELAAETLFAAGTAQLLPGRSEMLKRIVTALDRRPAGYRYDLDVLLGRSGSEAGMSGGDLPAPPTLEIDRAGALAQAFQNSGAQESGIAAGLLPTAPGKLRLVIRLTDQARPRNLFLQAAPALGSTAGSAADSPEGAAQ